MSNEPTKAELTTQIAELQAEIKKYKTIEPERDLLKIERDQLKEAVNHVRGERDTYKEMVLFCIDALIDKATK